MNKKIYIILLASLVVLSGVVFWATTKPLRFEAVVLSDGGTTLNEDFETIQFEVKDELYQSWDDCEVIQSSTLDTKQQLEVANVLFYQNKNILFTGAPARIATTGLSNSLSAKEDFIKGYDNSYSAQNGETIDKNDIVKISNRQYFIASRGEIFVDGASKGVVEAPLFIIDKSGSVTVFTDNTKTRYVGHLTFKVDDSTIFNVSQEIYQVGETIIDLTKYGGTDNEMLVVDGEESSTNENETNENEEKNTDGGNNQNDGNNENPQNKADYDELLKQIEQLPSNADIESLNDAIENINAQSKKHKIPTIRIDSIFPSATEMEAFVHVQDVSGTLVGQVEYDILDENNQVITGQQENKEQTHISFSQLMPSQSYRLQITYRYDLGDGSGIRELSQKTDLFKTLSVQAIYFTEVTSSTITSTVQLDTEVPNVERAELYLLDKNTTKDVVMLGIGTQSISSETVTFKKLQPEKLYELELRIYLENGQSIILNPKVVETKAAYLMREVSLTQKADQIMQVAYDFEAPDFDTTQVDIKLQARKLFMWEDIEYEVLTENDNVVDIVPFLNKTKQELRVIVSISGYNSETEESFTVEQRTKDYLQYENKNILEKEIFPQNQGEQQVVLTFTMNEGIQYEEYTVVFESKISDGSWIEISNRPLYYEMPGIELKAIDKNINAQQYRVKLLRDNKVVSQTNLNEE